MANESVDRAASKAKRESILSRFVRPFVRLGEFVRESYVETFHKSSWPTWKELKQMTSVVIFAILVVAVWIGTIDFILSKLTEQIAGGYLVR
ncbi:MAG: preprotein translocase subunit SecE [Armatimonadota bacterium]